MKTIEDDSTQQVDCVRARRVVLSVIRNWLYGLEVFKRPPCGPGEYQASRRGNTSKSAIKGFAVNGP